MYIPFHIHTNYSWDGYLFIDKLVKKISDYNIPAAMITEHGNMSSCVEFSEDMLKKGHKPILGNELYVSMFPATEKTEANRHMLHMVCVAKNKQGFKDLCKITSKSNYEENFYYRPRLDLKQLGELATNNLLWFTGHLGSVLHHAIDTALASDKVKVGELTLAKLSDLFGKENIRIEVQRICHKDSDYHNLLREISSKTGIKTVACIDAHYLDKEDKKNHNLLLCSALGTTLKKYRKKLEDNVLLSFFDNDYYHLPTPEEMDIHPEDERKNLLELNDICESYSLKEQPSLPRFSNNEKQELEDLCLVGWNDLVKKSIIHKDNESQYKDRMNYELQVIREFDLEGYFLIVQDFINWSRSQGAFPSIGRGSAGGSLISYLIGITQVDPIQHDLLFARFLNKGRLTKTNIEYPDIDVDLPVFIRDKVVQYIKEKYGPENVAQIATFSTLKGAGAFKEVLRMHEACSFTEMNKITKEIPNEASIADQLQEQNEKSILRFVLKNSTILDDYVRLEDDKLVGDYAAYCEQAMEIEGVIKAQSVHAAGLIISPTALENRCPLARSKDGMVVGIDMDSAKKIGMIKFDLLNLNSYDKLMEVNKYFYV